MIRQHLTPIGFTILLALRGLAVLGQTASPSPSPTPPPAPGASGHLEIKYVRDSSEYAALTRQIYRLAGEAVAAAARSLPANGWAVVLDIDETALDNSAYQLERAAYGLPFAQPSWQA